MILLLLAFFFFTGYLYGRQSVSKNEIDSRFYTDSDITKNDEIILFKLYDFTTEIVGRYDEENECCYVQRADGTRYNYTWGIEWKKEVNR